MESLRMAVGAVKHGGGPVAAAALGAAVARRLPSALTTLGAAAVPIGAGGTRGCGGGWRLPSVPVALGAAAVQEDDGSYRCRRP
uniref:Uncharacterized protein n=1 Tax=Oryza glumipatula TaxID=40148 RepID=A0A0D9YBL5_9ORYZ